jgi:hypothetical protein
VKTVATTLLLLALAAPAGADDGKTHTAGKVAWSAVLGSVAVYEAWAVTTHHETMSQAVQRHKATRIAVGIGLGALSVHIFWPTK